MAVFIFIFSISKVILMLYKLLRSIVFIGTKLYYKEFKVRHADRLNLDDPIILVANHPNTLMDAWIVGLVSKRPVHFMAKATFFSSPLRRKILKSLFMIPINRKSDSVTQGVSNEDSFQACYEVLENRQTLAIFPEGTSFSERILRELKSGAARIALEAEYRNEGKLGLKIVPLGINYLQAEKFRSDVLVHVGKPIVVADFLEEYSKNKSFAAKRLTELMRVRLEHSLAYLDSKENEDLIEKLYLLFESKYIRKLEKGVIGEVELYKEIRNAIDEIQISQSWKMKEIEKDLSAFQAELDSLGIHASFLDRRFRLRMFIRQTIVSIILLILLFPAFLFGFVHNVLQYKFTDFIVPKIAKDLEYYAPLAILVSMLVYPSVYLLFIFVVNHYVDLNWQEGILYFCLMLGSGLLAISYHKYLQHLKQKLTYMSKVFRNRSKLIDLKKRKIALKELIFGNK